MDELTFMNQEDFRKWLDLNHNTSPGRWIQFDKKKEISSLTYEEALDIALSYGWIDGVVRRIDDQFYVRYFTQRLKTSVWSTKNKRTIERLFKENRMMPSGIKAVEDAKQDGRWDKADLPPEDFDVQAFKELLKSSQLALKNYHAFSSSIQKTYAMSYYTLKKIESREKRLRVIIERLEKNLKPM